MQPEMLHEPSGRQKNTGPAINVEQQASRTKGWNNLKVFFLCTGAHESFNLVLFPSAKVSLYFVKYQYHRSFSLTPHMVLMLNSSAISAEVGFILAVMLWVMPSNLPRQCSLWQRKWMNCDRISVGLWEIMTSQNVMFDWSAWLTAASVDFQKKAYFTLINKYSLPFTFQRL